GKNRRRESYCFKKHMTPFRYILTHLHASQRNCDDPTIDLSSLIQALIKSTQMDDGMTTVNLSMEPYPFDPPSSDNAEENKASSDLVDTSKWECKRCTFQNDQASPECYMCGEVRKLELKVCVCVLTGEERTERVDQIKHLVKISNQKNRENKNCRPFLRLNISEVTSAIDTTKNECPVGIIRLLYSVGVQPVRFCMKEKDKYVYEIDSDEVYIIDPYFNLLQKASYHTYPLLCIHYVCVFFVLFLFFLKKKKTLLYRQYNDQLFFFPFFFLIELRKDLFTCLSECELMKESVSFRHFLEAIADYLYGPAFKYLDVLSDFAREGFLCTIFDRNAVNGTFRGYVNDSIGDYWLVKYVLKDYHFLRSFTRQRCDHALNLLFYLIRVHNWHDSTKLLECFPDNFVVSDSRSYSTFIQQAFEQGEIELADLMLRKPTLAISKLNFAAGDMTKFQQWYTERVLSLTKNKKFHFYPQVPKSSASTAIPKDANDEDSQQDKLDADSDEERFGNFVVILETSTIIKKNDRLLQIVGICVLKKNEMTDSFNSLTRSNFSTA
ncbi:hypothetical protein RFI_29101, partial [Reticulomyxa filosa]